MRAAVPSSNFLLGTLYGTRLGGGKEGTGRVGGRADSPIRVILETRAPGTAGRNRGAPGEARGVRWTPAEVRPGTRKGTPARILKAVRVASPVPPGAPSEPSDHALP
nr:hypothetical protein StreXyl84_38870 [Streptomyces sp. Xyl84]